VIALDKLPDLDSGSPAPRAFMYLVSSGTSSYSYRPVRNQAEMNEEDRRGKRREQD
jgi:hypothetical protein